MRYQATFVILAILLSSATPVRAQDPFWKPLPGFNRDAVVTALAADDTGNLYLGAGHLGIFKSTDTGVTWNYLGFAETASAGIVVTPRNDIFAIQWYTPLGHGILYRSTDRGSTWTASRLGSSLVVTSLGAAPNGVLFAGTQYGGLFRSTNDGFSWQHLDAALLSDQVIRSICVTDTLEVFIGTENGVYRSVDQGLSWEHRGLSSYFIASLTELSDRLYAGTPFGLWSSDDSGSTWLKIGPDYVWRMDIRSNLLLALSDKGVFFTHPDSTVWHSLSSGLENIIVLGALVIDADGYPLVGTSGHGVFRGIHPVELPHPPVRIQPTNGSKSHPLTPTFSWEYSPAIPRVEFQLAADSEMTAMMIVDTILAETVLESDSLDHASDYYWRLSSHNYFGRSAYTDPWVFSTEPAPPPSVPLSYRLEQNYPNPFNHGTRIVYSLAIRDFVHISIYDLFGDVVAILESREREPGSYSIDWTGFGFPSGIYFCKYVSTGFSAEKKMLMIK